MPRIASVLALLLLLGIATGCQAPDPMSQPLNLPNPHWDVMPKFAIGSHDINPNFGNYATRNIAVMPIQNESSLIAVPRVCMYTMARDIRGRGYWVREPWSTEKFLGARGVTMGGQLGTWADSRWNFRTDLPPDKLCDDLGVDALMMGRIGSTVEVIAGYGNIRKVSLSWMLVARDGTPLWRADATGWSGSATKDKKEARDLAIGHTVRRLLENVQQVPLYPEIWAATQACLQTLPHPR